MTVNGLYDMYYAEKSHDVRETTLKKIDTSFRLHVLPIVGHYSLSKVNVAVLQDWKNGINSKKLCVVTKQNIYGYLRGFLNWGVKSQHIPNNPLSNVDNFRDAYYVPKKDKLRYYTKEQFKQYIAVAEKMAVEKNDYRYYIFFMIAFYTGMRKGEINALKWSDITGNTIHVKRSVAQKLKDADRETPPKNKSSYRTLQMPVPLIQALNAQKNRHKKISPQISDMRVCGCDRFLRDTTIDKYNRRFALAVELPHIAIHDFRHSHASLLAFNAINIQEIARRLGHAKVEQTWNTYSHLYPQEEERALTILNEA